MSIKRVIVIIVLLILGFLFRLALSYFFPQPFIYDQQVYQWIADIMRTTPLYTDPFRSYGYPLFIAITDLLVGKGRIGVVIIQSLLDVLTGYILFLIAKNIFHSFRNALFVCALYLLNPFISAYTGILLSEILATFLVILVLYSFLKVVQNKKRFNFFLASISIGLLPQVKPSFQLLSFCLLGFLFYYTFKIFNHIKGSTIHSENILSPFHNLSRNYSKNIITIILIIIFYTIPYLYPLAGNIIYHRELNPFPVFNNFVKELYLSLYIDRPLNFISTPYPQEVWKTHSDYSYPTNKYQRKEVTQKYLIQIKNEIGKNPVKFISWRIKKMLFIWEKHLLFTYQTSLNPYLTPIIYLGNIFLLFTALCGIFIWRNSLKDSSDFMSYFLHLICFILIYITVSHAFSIADERYTIVMFPVICLFSGYFIMGKTNR